MNLDNLMIKLEEMRKIHGGEIEVFHWDDWAAFSVEEVNFREYEHDIPSKYILLGQEIHGFGNVLETNYEDMPINYDFKPSQKSLIAKEDWSKVEI